MRFYTASKLGSKRSYTPEGFLVCLDVPIARTGEMIYVVGEIPDLLPGKDGLIRVQRDPDEVFKPEAMASFVGKPTTNDHPPEFVTPANFRRYACGSVQNVRRGTGADSDLELADLIWTDPTAIKAIEGGKDEVSCGYDAEYEQDVPGFARQVCIVGNHVALVAEGRCGSRCAIGDSAEALQATKAAAEALADKSPPEVPATDAAPPCGCGGHHPHHDNAAPAAKPARKRKTRDMTTKPMKLRGSMLDRVRRAFSAKDEAGFEEAMTAVESAAEVSQEAEEKAEFASMIGEAVASAIAPVVARLDEVDAYIGDRKTRDAEEAAAKTAAEKAEAEKAAAAATTEEGAAGKTKDNEALAAFLNAKGLSDEDIAEAVKMLPEATADSLEEGSAPSGEASVAASSGDPSPDGGATAPLYNAGASSQLDSAVLATTFRDTVARAEILAPGIKMPTFDAKATGKVTSDALCALRRTALERALDSADRKKIVAPFVTDAAAIAKMGCAVVKMAFIGASEAAKAANKPAARTADAAVPSTMADRAKALWG